MGHRSRVRSASSRLRRGQADVSDVVGALLEDATHALITAYARRRKRGERVSEALIEGLSDVAESAIGVRVVRRAQAAPRAVRSAPIDLPPEIDRELQEIERLKKIVDG